MKKIVFLTLSAILILIGCSKKSNDMTGSGNDPLDCTTVIAKTYASDISPIIQTKCATNSNCHGSGSGNGPGALINYAAVFNSRASIRAAVASDRMPLTGSITPAQKNSILCWIDNGAENN